MKRLVGNFVLGSCLVLLTPGCAVRHRTAPLPPTFLEGVDISNRNEKLPFDHSARHTQGDFAFKAIFFPPIRTDLLPPDEWRKSKNLVVPSEAEYQKEAHALAEYFHSQILEAIRSDPKARYAVALKPGPGVAEMQIAFTELQFSQPTQRAAALVAPVPGSGVIASAMSDPHVAFAARIRDASSGTLLATVADRKYAPKRVLDLNKLTATSSPREICSLWAASIAQSLDSGGLTEVKEKNFDWKLW